MSIGMQVSAFRTEGRTSAPVVRPPPRLALIVPCYNEELLVESTCASLNAQLDALVAQHECSGDSFICFIDDGSTDATWAIVERLAATWPQRVRGVSLATNCGHQFALMAGIDFAAERTDASISLDADLQDDPAVMARMLEAYRRGDEIVLGVRRGRQSDTLFKKLTAFGYYRLLTVLGVPTIEQHADFRLLSRSAMRNLQKFPEYHLFLRGFPKLLHKRVSLVHYDRSPRLAGISKYPFWKMLRFAWIGVTSFSVVPLRIISLLGAAVFLISFILFVYSITAWLTGSTVPGWASITAPLYALGGMLMLSMGIVGEYVGKIYNEVKHRPRYLIDRVAGEGQAIDRED